MALEEILGALTKDGEADCQKALSEADALAKKITDDAKEAEKAFIQQQLDKAKLTLSVRHAKIINAANFHVKKEVVKAKQEVIEEIFSSVLKDAENIRKSPDYPAIFERLTTESIANFQGAIKAYVDPLDEGLARRTLDKLGVKYELFPNLKTLGGIKISSTDDKVSVSNIVELRLEKAKKVLKSELVSILFGEGS